MYCVLTPSKKLVDLHSSVYLKASCIDRWSSHCCCYSAQCAAHATFSVQIWWNQFMEKPITAFSFEHREKEKEEGKSHCTYTTQVESYQRITSKERGGDPHAYYKLQMTFMGLKLWQLLSMWYEVSGQVTPSFSLKIERKMQCMISDLILR